MDTAPVTAVPLPADIGRALTIDDLQLTPDDGRRYEIIDGGLHVSPAADTTHQLVADRLHALLRKAIGPDLEVLEAVNVQLAGSVIVPDLVVVPAAAIGALAFRADELRLVVEIVSPSSRTMDRVTEPSLLAADGVPAYWLVERGGAVSGGPSVVVHRLDDGDYRRTTVGAAERAALGWPAPLTLAPADLMGPRRS